MRCACCPSELGVQPVAITENFHEFLCGVCWRAWLASPQCALFGELHRLLEPGMASTYYQSFKNERKAA